MPGLGLGLKTGHVEQAQDSCPNFSNLVSKSRNQKGPLLSDPLAGKKV
jgi:hypothetical protein